MSFFKKFFGLEESKPVEYPEVPLEMKGVFLKKIGMH